jgi:hypothetical protein
MNMKVANGGCCARKEESYCMIASAANDVAAYGSQYKRKQQKDEVLIIRLGKGGMGAPVVTN